MATPKNPDLSRDTGDTNRGLSGTSNYDDTSSGRGARPQDTAGRQSYGPTAGLTGSSTTQRDFYREAISRSMNRRGAETFRPYDRPEDFGASSYGSDRYGELQGRYEGSPQYGRGESYRGGQESYRGAQENYRGEDWQASQQRGTERQHEGSHLPGGRTMALGAAALGAAGVGLGLMRRGRWAKEALSAGEVMSRGVKSVLPEHTLREVARLMREENVGIVPVTDTQGRLLGVVTDRDLVVRAMCEDRMPSQVRVSDIMSADDLEVVTPEDAVNDVIELMGRKQVRRIPVVERDNRLVGIIAMADIATRAEYDEELQAALERISSRRSFWSRFG